MGQKTWSRPPITMDFDVVMYSASGMAVKYLKVTENSGYKSIKWIRYTTKAGSYQIRVHIPFFTALFVDITVKRTLKNIKNY